MAERTPGPVERQEIGEGVCVVITAGGRGTRGSVTLLKSTRTLMRRKPMQSSMRGPATQHASGPRFHQQQRRMRLCDAPHKHQKVSDGCFIIASVRGCLDYV
eukprot:971194-Pelagomonas_calceolata.AAC.1